MPVYGVQGDCSGITKVFLRLLCGHQYVQAGCQDVATQMFWCLLGCCYMVVRVFQVIARPVYGVQGGFWGVAKVFLWLLRGCGGYQGIALQLLWCSGGCQGLELVFRVRLLSDICAGTNGGSDVLKFDIQGSEFAQPLSKHHK